MATPISLPPPPSPTHPPPHLLLLQNCTTLAHLRAAHARMIRSGLASLPLPASHLVSAIASDPSPPSLDYARLVFSQIPNPTTFTFNSLLRAYCSRGPPSAALRLYLHLLLSAPCPPDRFTFPSLFKSCRSLPAGRQLHSHALKLGLASDTFIQNTLTLMYAECGSVADARMMFDKMPHRTVVSWATMIAAYAKRGDPGRGIEVYRAMLEEDVEPNGVVLVNVLTACARARDLETAREVHRYVETNRVERNVVLWAAILDVYCKCGRVSDARKLFDEMPERNLFCWNIMIKGHVEDGDYREALGLFREMQARGIRGDQITMASLVLVCAHLGALELGKWLHLYIQREKIEVDVVLGTGLVDMYAKCGCVESATRVFEEMPFRDVMTWTALIGGLATSGHGERALQVFDKMQRSGVRPDAVTFVGVLAACSYAGLVEKGRFLFDSMSRDHGIEPTVEHYGCMVDLLGRAGLIDDAEELISKMPMAPDFFVLENLLGACRIHRRLEVAERTARRLLELDSKNGATYVLLSNMYASLNNWDECKRIKELMREKNIKRPSGCSMIEVGGEVHEFVMGGGSHPRSGDISAMIDDMNRRLKAAGYAAKKSQEMLNMDEEEEEDGLCWHSEKLAIAFGLIGTSPGTPIRVRKTLRVCGDCHAAIKRIAELYEREIVVRDRFRFHHFKNGSCSCKDFW